MTDKKLEGQLALVTGASRGIGAATAEALAGAGAHVILVARTVAGLEEVEDRIHAAGGTATIAPLDLTDGESVGKLAAAVAQRWAKLDMLVLNAATLGTLTPVPAIDGKEFGRVLTVNLVANQALLAAFDGALRESGTARVLALTSSVAGRPRAYWGAYAASKAALEALVLTYGEEVRSFGIAVGIVDPGATATQMRGRAFPGEDKTALKSPDTVGAAIAELLAGGFETGHRLDIRI